MMEYTLTWEPWKNPIRKNAGANLAGTRDTVLVPIEVAKAFNLPLKSGPISMGTYIKILKVAKMLNN